MGARRLALTIPAALVVLIGTLLFSSAPALAAEKFELVGTFGSASTTPANPEPLAEPDGVAVASDTLKPAESEVYVADKGNNRVERFSSTGTYLGQFNGEAAPTGAFADPTEVAVDNSTNPLDPSAGDVYVLDAGHNVIDKFTATGTYIGQLTKFGTGEVGTATGIAVDPEGNLWVNAGGYGDDLIDGFSNAVDNTLTESFYPPNTATSEQGGIAVDSQDNVYIENAYYSLELTPPIRKIDKGGTAESRVAIGGPGGLAVDESTNNLYSVESRSISESGPFGEPANQPIRQFGSEAGLNNNGRGIAIEPTSEQVYVVNSATGTVDIFGNAPVLPAPSTAAVSQIGTTSATLNGTVNPNEVQVTSCAFEYGTGTSYGNSVPCAQTSQEIGQGNQAVAVSAQVSGLQPDETYHFRLAVSNAGHPPYFGEDSSFITVNTPRIQAESFSSVGPGSATISAQVDPEGLATTYYAEYGLNIGYGSKTAIGKLEATHNSTLVQMRLTGLTPNTEYHFRIVAANEAGETQGGDVSLTTLPPVLQNLPDGRVYEQVSRQENQGRNIDFPYVSNQLDGNGYSGNGSHQPFQPAQSGNSVIYAGEASSPGGTGGSGLGFSNEYRATRLPGGGWAQVNIQPAGYAGAVYQAFSSELSTGILFARSEGSEGSEGGVYRPPLSPLVAPGVGALYERTLDGEDYNPLFTVKPPTRPESLEAYEVPYNEASEQGIKQPAYAGSSADGSRLLFEADDALTPEADAGEYYENNLYESVNGQLHLVNVLPDGSTEARATFGARHGPEGNGPDFSHVISENGSRIFWTDLNTGIIYMRENATKTVQVSPGSAQYTTATPDGRYAYYIENRQLWRFDADADTSTELTPPAGSAEKVLGVIGVGGDGEYLYFVARGALATGAIAGEANIYLSHDGTTSFITTVGENEGEEMAPFNSLDGEPSGDWAPGMRGRTSEVTPDGHAMVFMSSLSLTGYNNTGDSEVYIYEAEGNRLFCASCDPSGERPSTTNLDLDNGHSAGYLPTDSSNTYVPQWMSDDGDRVFFDSDVPLVAQDTNNRQDVYEWERDGSGSCQESRGCIYLLSGGLNSAASWLIGASASGDDVFFVTRAKLNPEDGGEAYVVYDARAGGVQPPQPPACSGTGCQGVPAAPPIFATPSSVTFNGVGNFPSPSTTTATPGPAKKLTRAQQLAKALKACKNKRQKKRRACEAQARKRYGKKSNTDKAAKGKK